MVLRLLGILHHPKHEGAAAVFLILFAQVDNSMGDMESILGQ